MFLGPAVAVEAPAHAQRLLMHDDRHLVDLAVAANTADAPVDVLGMIEVGVVGQAMDPLPFERDALLKTLAHRGKQGAGRLDGLVAVLFEWAESVGSASRVESIQASSPTQ